MVGMDECITDGVELSGLKLGKSIYVCIYVITCCITAQPQRGQLTTISVATIHLLIIKYKWTTDYYGNQGEGSCQAS